MLRSFAIAGLLSVLLLAGCHCGYHHRKGAPCDQRPCGQQCCKPCCAPPAGQPAQ